jgi:hypothetical protein
MLCNCVIISSEHVASSHLCLPRGCAHLQGFERTTNHRFVVLCLPMFLFARGREQLNAVMRWCNRRHCYCEREFPHTLRFAETKVRTAGTTPCMGIYGNKNYKRYRYRLAQLHCKNPYSLKAYLNSVVDIFTLNSESTGFESWLTNSLSWITPPQSFLSSPGNTGMLLGSGCFLQHLSNWAAH